MKEKSWIEEKLKEKLIDLDTDMNIAGQKFSRELFSYLQNNPDVRDFLTTPFSLLVQQHPQFKYFSDGILKTKNLTLLDEIISFLKKEDFKDAKFSKDDSGNLEGFISWYYVGNTIIDIIMFPFSENPWALKTFMKDVQQCFYDLCQKYKTIHWSCHPKNPLVPRYNQICNICKGVIDKNKQKEFAGTIEKGIYNYMIIAEDAEKNNLWKIFQIQKKN